MSDRTLGAVLVAVSAAAFGSMAVFGVWAQEDGTDTLALIFVRFALASVVLLAVVRMRRVTWPPLRRWWPVAALGGIGYVGQATCYFLALEYAQASLVALLLYLFPAFVTVLAVVFLGDRPHLVTMLALALSLLGTVLVVGGGSGRLLGIILAVSAAVIYSVYIVVGSVVTTGLDVIVVSTVICCSAAVVTGLLNLAAALTGHAQSFPDGPKGWGSLVAIAVICTAGAILAFFSGLPLLGPTATSVLSTVEPVVTVALATTLLGERLGPVQVLGGALVLGAVIWLALSHREPIAAAEAPPV